MNRKTYGGVVSVSAGAKLTMYEGIYVNPYVDPPLNEEEATEAVNEMNGYQSRAEVGTWHTPQASLAHEEHHRRQWEDAYKFYWKCLKSRLSPATKNRTWMKP